MDNQITKEDLRLFSQTIITELKEFFNKNSREDTLDWVKAKVARQLLSISAASLQSIHPSNHIFHRLV